MAARQRNHERKSFQVLTYIRTYTALARLLRASLIVVAAHCTRVRKIICLRVKIVANVWDYYYDMKKYRQQACCLENGRNIITTLHACCNFMYVCMSFVFQTRILQ